MRITRIQPQFGNQPAQPEPPEELIAEFLDCSKVQRIPDERLRRQVAILLARMKHNRTVLSGPQAGSANSKLGPRLRALLVNAPELTLAEKNAILKLNRNCLPIKQAQTGPAFKRHSSQYSPGVIDDRYQGRNHAGKRD